MFLQRNYSSKTKTKSSISSASCIVSSIFVMVWKKIIPDSNSAALIILAKVVISEQKKRGSIFILCSTEAMTYLLSGFIAEVIQLIESAPKSLVTVGTCHLKGEQARRKSVVFTKLWKHSLIKYQAGLTDYIAILSFQAMKQSILEIFFPNKNAK